MNSSLLWCAPPVAPGGALFFALAVGRSFFLRALGLAAAVSFTARAGGHERSAGWRLRIGEGMKSEHHNISHLGTGFPGTSSVGTSSVGVARRAGILAGALVLAGLLGSGCEKPVFTPDEPRSQYDRFDAIRDQRAPSHIYDEFGDRRPNVRQRLLTGE